MCDHRRARTSDAARPGAEETAPRVSPAAAAALTLRKADLFGQRSGLSRSPPPATVRRVRGAQERAREEPRAAGERRLPDAAATRAKRSRRRQAEQGGDTAVRGGVHPSPAAASAFESVHVGGGVREYGRASALLLALRLQRALDGTRVAALHLQLLCLGGGGRL